MKAIQVFAADGVWIVPIAELLGEDLDLALQKHLGTLSSSEVLVMCNGSLIHLVHHKPQLTGREVRLMATLKRVQAELRKIGLADDSSPIIMPLDFTALVKGAENE